MIYSTTTLRYRLLVGPTPLEPFRVLASRTVDWRGWDVTFRVLGASHAVSLEREGRRLVELLTCAAPTGASPALVDQGVESSVICVTACGLVGRVCLTPFPLREGDALRGHFPAADQLAVAFPAVALEQTPLTRIGWRILGRQLVIETVHTYPEEEQGVRTESRFEPEAAS